MQEMRRNGNQLKGFWYKEMVEKKFRTGVRKLKNRIRSREGFSMAETMISCIILLLSTAVIVQCLGIGMRMYSARILESESRVLCSTLSASLQHELLYAEPEGETKDGRETWFSNFYDLKGGTFLTEAEGDADRPDRVLFSNGREFYSPAPDSAYLPGKGKGGKTQGLRAEILMDWDPENERYEAVVRVYDGSGEDRLLQENCFAVQPLNY